MNILSNHVLINKAISFKIKIF